MLIAFHEITGNADWTIERIAQPRIILAGVVTASEPRASCSVLHQGCVFGLKLCMPDFSLFRSL
jgi:hypothetical protein